MALGEAFVNVRGNLTPFAKDVEKGVKAILAQAEKRIAADPSLGKAIGEKLKNETGRGASDGLEEGFERGVKKGGKKALNAGSKFFAAFADFADDGLSAIPPQAKAAIFLGLLTGAAAAAPLIGAVISAAVTGGVAGAVAGLGIALAFQLKDVQDTFLSVGRDILGRLRSAATVFVVPLKDAAGELLATFNRIESGIGTVFSGSADLIAPLTTAVTGLVENLIPGLESSVRGARPLFAALETSLPRLGDDLARTLDTFAASGPQAATGLRDFLKIVGALAITTAQWTSALANAYYWVRVIGEVVAGDVNGAISIYAQRANDAALASEDFTQKGLAELNPALGKTAAEAKAAALAISDLLKEELKGVNASINYQQALDDLRLSLKENGKEFRVTEEVGRANLRLVESAITAAAEQRDAEIVRAQETGRSIDDINAAYQREINKIQEVIGKNITQDGTLKTLFATARNAPKEVAISVTAPGIEAVIGRFKTLGQSILDALNKAKTKDNPSGYPKVSGYSAGAILNEPTMGLVAEAGYAEAIIPDPTVKPQRALELSNQFGLTSLIADTLGRGTTIVNVSIGNEQLARYIDGRISYSNIVNATAMAQGPRGV